ncbi:LOW QUALITY PROTEIN: hypothetical protein YC2023_089366 [Brassica napus]
MEVQTTLAVAMFLLSCGLPNLLPLSFLILLLQSQNPGGKSMLMSYFLFFTDAGREGECKQLPGHGCPSIRFCCSYQCANAVVSYLNMVRGRATGLFIEMSKDDYCPITFLLKIIVLLQYLSSFTMNNPSVDVVLDYAKPLLTEEMQVALTTLNEIKRENEQKFLEHPQQGNQFMTQLGEIRPEEMAAVTTSEPLVDASTSR